MSAADDVERFIRRNRERLDRCVAAVATQAQASIVLKTPVDTGELRRSWQIDGALAWGGEVSVWTSLPYAPTVEYGLYPGVGAKTVKTGEGIFSKQAPGGMVRLTVKEMKVYAEELWGRLNSGRT